jgi:hypothetical protein
MLGSDRQLLLPTSAQFGNSLLPNSIRNRYQLALIASQIERTYYHSSDSTRKTLNVLPVPRWVLWAQYQYLALTQTLSSLSMRLGLNFTQEKLCKYDSVKVDYSGWWKFEGLRSLGTSSPWA